jgi:hypothetical protein
MAEQPLKIISLWLLDGSELQGSVYGSYCAFNCPCGKHPPLIVSWEASTLLKMNEVTCPSCHRRYKTKGGRILFGRGDISVVEIPRRPR